MCLRSDGDDNASSVVAAILERGHVETLKLNFKDIGNNEVAIL